MIMPWNWYKVIGSSMPLNTKEYENIEIRFFCCMSRLSSDKLCEKLNPNWHCYLLLRRQVKDMFADVPEKQKFLLSIQGRLNRFLLHNECICRVNAIVQSVEGVWVIILMYKVVSWWFEISDSKSFWYALWSFAKMVSWLKISVIRWMAIEEFCWSIWAW